jgi:cytochrome c oxidase cbb3-type subunit 4
MDLLSLYGVLRPLWIVWFFVLFIGVVWWAFGKRRRARLQDHALIPFRED